MAFRVLTRSTSKTQNQQLPANPSPIASRKNRNNRNKKTDDKKQGTQSQDEMDFDLMDSFQLESELNPASDFVPECFLSQPRTDTGSQLSDAAFGIDLLQAGEPADLEWKYRTDPADAAPSTQLEMVNGINQVLECSSLLYSPASSAAPSSPASPPERKTMDELLDYYLTSSDKAALSDDGDDTADIADEDLLDDLDSILSSYNGPDADESLANIRIEYNPPADTVALALSSQYEEGILVIEDDQSQTSDDNILVPESVSPAPAVAAASSRGKKAAAKKTSPSASRGRKRKASVNSDSAYDEKKRQNAVAAKNYRKRKAEQMSKVFEEKEEVEKELEKARKKLQGKLNERNVLLKMLYESYTENGHSAPHKIVFPAWIESWYQKQKDE